jgi:AcrR family transcriptional regulator
VRTVNPEAYAAKRAAILGAAAEVFAANGYDAATTAAICRTAGIGSGTFFHYFGDKRSAFVALFADDFAVNEAFIATLADRPPREALDALVDHLLRDVADPLAPGLVHAAIMLAGRDQEFAAVVRANDDQVRQALTEILADLDVPAPARAARWVLALTDTVCRMTGDEGFVPAVETVEVRTVIERYLRL